MIKRQAVEAIEAQKHQMISALYANSAYSKYKEGPKDRAEQIKELEKHFSKAVELVYNPNAHKGEEIDWKNPFWSAHKRAYQKTLDRISGENKTVQQVLQFDEEQLAARESSRKEIDQR